MWLKGDVSELRAVYIVWAPPPPSRWATDLFRRGKGSREILGEPSATSCSSSPSSSILRLAFSSPAASRPLPYTRTFGFLFVVLQRSPLELYACGFSPNQSILHTQIRATTTRITAVRYTALPSSPNSQHGSRAPLCWDFSTTEPPMAFHAPAVWEHLRLFLSHASLTSAPKLSVLFLINF